MPTWNTPWPCLSAPVQRRRRNSPALYRLLPGKAAETQQGDVRQREAGNVELVRLLGQLWNRLCYSAQGLGTAAGRSSHLSRSLTVGKVEQVEQVQET